MRYRKSNQAIKNRYVYKQCAPMINEADKNENKHDSMR